MTSLEALRAHPHLSVSQLKSFIACPRRYRLQYIDRIVPMFRAAALAFGSAWHATIDEWLLRVAPGETAPPTIELKHLFADELAREVDRDGPPVLFDDEDDSVASMISTGHRMVDAFVVAMPVPDRVVGIEIPFSLTLEDDETGEVLDVPLVGALDALVIANGTPVVLELKTAKRRWSRDQIEFDAQPAAYRLAARELGYEAQVSLVVTTKTSRPELQLELARRGRADERDLLATAASLLRAIAAGVDHPVRSWACRTCPFAGACR